MKYAPVKFLKGAVFLKVLAANFMGLIIQFLVSTSLRNPVLSYNAACSDACISLEISIFFMLDVLMFTLSLLCYLLT